MPLVKITKTAPNAAAGKKYVSGLSGVASPKELQELGTGKYSLLESLMISGTDLSKGSSMKS